MAELYTTAPAARAAEISESTLRLWARLGIVPSQVTASGMRLFLLPDVLRVARERARGEAAESAAELVD
jgi:DNA-binding transcriptional MerR regulator